MEYSIVTGGSGVLGKEVAKFALLRGENVYILGRSGEKLTLIERELSAKFPKSIIKTAAVDLASETARAEFFKSFAGENGIVSALYFVAGVDTQKAFIKYDERRIINQARVNYEAALSFTNYALKNKGKNLNILAVSSLTGVTPMPYFAEYASLKGALISFFKALRYELKGTGVSITVLAPGSIPTRDDIIADIKKQGLTGKMSAKSPEYVVKKAFKCLDKNKFLCIPGGWNKVVYVLSKLAPPAITERVISKKFRNKEKDAFG